MEDKDNDSMFRKILIATAFSSGTLLAFASPASAASYGAVTLSFGSSSGYYDDAYDDAYDVPYYVDSYDSAPDDRYYACDDGYNAQPYVDDYRNDWSDDDDEDE
jgi:hypothetical protein